MRTTILAVILFLGSSCGSGHSGIVGPATCATADDCGATALCFMSACAFLDSSCGSGYRFDSSANNGLANQCVAMRPGGDPDGGILHETKVPWFKQGDACTANDDCISGFCSDGFCCDTRCEGTCRACNVPGFLGTCRDALPGTNPRGICQPDATACGHDGSCDGSGSCRFAAKGRTCSTKICAAGVLTNTAYCDGAGTCGTATTRVCDPYVCKPDGSDCFSTCTVAGTECKAPAVCLNGTCGAAGNGAACQNDGQCSSTHCVDGVCCLTPSCAACSSCAVNGVGTCSPLGAGVVDSRCTMTNASTCGTSGSCDGSGACAFYDKSTVCGTERCTTNNPVRAYHGTAYCSGAGSGCPQRFDGCGAYSCRMNDVFLTSECYPFCGCMPPFAQMTCAPGRTCGGCDQYGVGTCM